MGVPRVPTPGEGVLIHTHKATLIFELVYTCHHKKIRSNLWYKRSITCILVVTVERLVSFELVSLGASQPVLQTVSVPTTSRAWKADIPIDIPGLHF